MPCIFSSSTLVDFDRIHFCFSKDTCFVLGLVFSHLLC